MHIHHKSENLKADIFRKLGYLMKILTSKYLLSPRSILLSSCSYCSLAPVFVAWSLLPLQWQQAPEELNSCLNCLDTYISHERSIKEDDFIVRNSSNTSSSANAFSCRFLRFWFSCFHSCSRHG